MFFPIRTRAACLALGLVLASGTGGCSYLTPTKPQASRTDKKTKAPPLETKIIVDGQAMALGQPDKGIAARTEFLQRFENLVQESRLHGARAWVERHPDITIAALRDVTHADLSNNIPLILAQFHDDQTGNAGTPESWGRLFENWRAQPAAFNAYALKRHELLMLMREGKFAEAALVPLVPLAETTQHPLPLQEAWEFKGITELLIERPAEAALAFQRSLEVPVGTPQATHTLLLLSEAHRRAGQTEWANDTWADAIELGSQWLSRDRPVADPSFWERASYLQPVQWGWPPQLVERLTMFQQRTGPIVHNPITQGVIQVGWNPERPDATAAIWGCIGSWRLERGEAQAALLAFKRAESSSEHPQLQAWMRLAQARTLARMGQRPAATTILMALAASNIEPVSWAALADLGTLKVQDGMTAQGLQLLRRAVEQPEFTYWPGRTQAEADLGLAYLMVGEEAEGLRWLSHARQQFHAQGDFEMLSKALWNEARYYEHMGQKKRAKDLREELALLQY